VSPRPARSGRCLSVEVPAELLEALRAAAADRGQPLAELVRRILAAAVAGPAAAPGPDPLADRLEAIEARLEALEAIEARVVMLERGRLADLQAQELERNRARRGRL
jgi:plasmid stability protein